MMLPLSILALLALSPLPRSAGSASPRKTPARFCTGSLMILPTETPPTTSPPFFAPGAHSPHVTAAPSWRACVDTWSIPRMCPSTLMTTARLLPLYLVFHLHLSRPARCALQMKVMKVMRSLKATPTKTRSGKECNAPLGRRAGRTPMAIRRSPFFSSHAALYLTTISGNASSARTLRSCLCISTPLQALSTTPPPHVLPPSTAGRLHYGSHC